MVNTTNFNKYESRKEVFAEPMNELDAVKLGYARPNEDNHEWRNGYHILYPDGYHSWCPASTFLKDYHCINDWVDRLKFERLELMAKRVVLESFIEEKAEEDWALDADLLALQLDIMKAYEAILALRIRKATEKEDSSSCEEDCNATMTENNG